MVFCNIGNSDLSPFYRTCHNPYFNRWFSAMVNPDLTLSTNKSSHNPYFNRWFSAIYTHITYDMFGIGVTILILIDGFLQ